MKPNACAIATSRFAPTSSATGANTELQLSANACTNDPPQSSWWKFRRRQPFRTTYFSYGYVSVSAAVPAVSAAEAVTVLNDDPGGWVTSMPSPASARTAPVRGSSTTIPP